MATCDHDQRFKDTFFATNGCVACECERQAARATAAEQQLSEIANFLGKDARHVEVGPMTIAELVKQEFRRINRSLTESEKRAIRRPQILKLDPNRECNAQDLTIEESTTHIPLTPEEPLCEPTGGLPPSKMDRKQPGPRT